MNSIRQKGVFRFGVYEVDRYTGELRKNGIRLKLHEQPCQVLVMLLERPGELVTREEIRQRLWPADTFVDFDHSLNTVINKVREVLSDSASNPRFIETLARRGYRFLAPVEFVGEGSAVTGPTRADTAQANVVAPAGEAAPAAAGNGQGLAAMLASPQELPLAPRTFVRLLFLLIQVMYLTFYIVALARLPHVEDLLEGAVTHPAWIIAVLIVTAVVGIPTRLYLLSAVAFDYQGLGHKFQKLFPLVFVLDELWALAPFLLLQHIGFGLALAATAALIYLPFSQRSLLLMGYRQAERP